LAAYEPVSLQDILGRTEAAMDSFSVWLSCVPVGIDGLLSNRIIAFIAISVRQVFWIHSSTPAAPQSPCLSIPLGLLTANWLASRRYRVVWCGFGLYTEGGVRQMMMFNHSRGNQRRGAHSVLLRVSPPQFPRGSAR
jgi:hypothetical protein